VQHWEESKFIAAKAEFLLRESVRRLLIFPAILTGRIFVTAQIRVLEPSGG
jgi:hypothetical protein